MNKNTFLCAATTATQRATATSREQGTERANTGTASVCGKATEKVDPEASLKSGCGGPLFGGSRPLTAQKGVQHQENERYVLLGGGPRQLTTTGSQLFVCTLKGRNQKKYIVRTGSQCLFVPCSYSCCSCSCSCCSCCSCSCSCCCCCCSCSSSCCCCSLLLFVVRCSLFVVRCSLCVCVCVFFCGVTLH